MSAPVMSATVYTRNRSSSWLLTASDGRQFQDQLNDAGIGKVSSPNDDASTAQLQYGRIVQFGLDGSDRFAMLIEDLVKVSVAASEEVDEITTASGRGTVAIMEEAIIDVPPGINLVTDTRHWNFATPELDDSAWTVPTTSTFSGFPPGWPDLNALWIWDRNPLVLSIPAGDVYFRSHFTTASTKSVDAWCVADDGYEIWLDGQKLFEDTLYDAAWTGQARNQHVSLPAGNHVVAVHARNNNALLAGLRATVVEVDAGGTVVGVLTHTDASWLMLAYPSQPPGFTIGRILNLLLAEAQARGAITDVSVSFSDTLDSNGAAWPNTWDVSAQVGDDLLAFLRRLAETYIDFGMAVTANTLHVWQVRGGTSGTSFTPNANLTTLQHHGQV